MSGARSGPTIGVDPSARPLRYQHGPGGLSAASTGARACRRRQAGMPSRTGPAQRPDRNSVRALCLGFWGEPQIATPNTASPDPPWATYTAGGGGLRLSWFPASSPGLRRRLFTATLPRKQSRLPSHPAARSAPPRPPSPASSSGTASPGWRRRRFEWSPA